MNPEAHVHEVGLLVECVGEGGRDRVIAPGSVPVEALVAMDLHVGLLLRAEEILAGEELAVGPVGMQDRFVPVGRGVHPGDIVHLLA